MVETADDQETGPNRSAARAWLSLLAGVIFFSYTPTEMWFLGRAYCNTLPEHTPLLATPCPVAWIALPLGLAGLLLSAWPLYRLISRHGRRAAFALFKLDGAIIGRQLVAVRSDAGLQRTATSGCSSRIPITR